MIDRDLRELGREIFTRDCDSADDVLRLPSFSRRVPSRQLREVEEGSDRLEQATAGDGLLRGSEKIDN